MVKTPLVVPDRTFAEEILADLDKAGFEVNVAAWVKQDDRWTLVLGSPRCETDGIRGAHLAMVKALKADGPVPISEFPIRLEGSDDPLVKTIRKKFRRTPAADSQRFGAFRGFDVQDGFPVRVR